MAIDGRINVDVLFHDTDGTTSLKVVSLEDSTAYATGKVAIVTGTVGTATATVNVAPTTYRDASGALVSFANLQRVAIKCQARGYLTQVGTDGQVSFNSGELAVAGAFSSVDALTLVVDSGTASFTLVLYGT